MDRQIDKKKWTAKKIVIIFIFIRIVLLIPTSYYLTSGKSKLNIDFEVLQGLRPGDKVITSSFENFHAGISS